MTQPDTTTASPADRFPPGRIEVDQLAYALQDLADARTEAARHPAGEIPAEVRENVERHERIVARVHDRAAEALSLWPPADADFPGGPGEPVAEPPAHVRESYYALTSDDPAVAEQARTELIDANARDLARQDAEHQYPDGDGRPAEVGAEQEGDRFTVSHVFTDTEVEEIYAAYLRNDETEANRLRTEALARREAEEAARPSVLDDAPAGRVPAGSAAGWLPTVSREEAAQMLARDGHDIESARAMVTEYLHETSHRIGSPVYQWGIDETDVEAIAARYDWVDHTEGETLTDARQRAAEHASGWAERAETVDREQRPGFASWADRQAELWADRAITPEPFTGRRARTRETADEQVAAAAGDNGQSTEALVAQAHDSATGAAAVPEPRPPSDDDARRAQLADWHHDETTAATAGTGDALTQGEHG